MHGAAPKNSCISADNDTYTIIIGTTVIKKAVANPPTNRPPPTAGDSDVVFVAGISKSTLGISQSVQALFTLS